MRRRAAPETADAPFAKSCKGAVASCKTYELNIFDLGSNGAERLTMLPSRLARKVMASLAGNRRSGRFIAFHRHCSERIRVFTGRHGVSKIRLELDDFDVLSGVFIDPLPSSEGKERQIHKLPNARLEMCQLPFLKSVDLADPHRTANRHATKE